MKFFDKIKTVLFKPDRFYSEIEKEKGVGKAFNYLAILSLFSIVLSSVIMFFIPRAYTLFFPVDFGGVSTFALIGSLIIGWVFAVLASFVIVGIIHIWLKIFRGKRKYSDTYKLYVYSNTPKLVFGWIPIVNFLIWIYTLVLLIIGTHKMYKFSWLKSVLVYVIPWIVIMVIAIFILLLVFVTLMNVVGTTAPVF